MTAYTELDILQEFSVGQLENTWDGLKFIHSKRNTKEAVFVLIIFCSHLQVSRFCQWFTDKDIAYDNAMWYKKPDGRHQACECFFFLSTRVQN